MVERKNSTNDSDLTRVFEEYKLAEIETADVDLQSTAQFNSLDKLSSLLALIPKVITRVENDLTIPSDLDVGTIKFELDSLPLDKDSAKNYVPSQVFFGTHTEIGILYEVLIHMKNYELLLGLYKKLSEKLESKLTVSFISSRVSTAQGAATMSFGAVSVPPGGSRIVRIEDDPVVELSEADMLPVRPADRPGTAMYSPLPEDAESPEGAMIDFGSDSAVPAPVSPQAIPVVSKSRLRLYLSSIIDVFKFRFRFKRKSS